MLAEAVRAGEGARRTGRRIGRGIASQRRGEDAVTVIVDEAIRLGFDPAMHRRPARQVDVVLRHCPFEDVATEDPETVCQLHLGLAEGVATSLGGVTVTGMDVRDPRRAGCRLLLQRDTTRDPAT
jgi:predicted ArsR family transcriptional regulator